MAQRSFVYPEKGTDSPVHFSLLQIFHLLVPKSNFKNSKDCKYTLVRLLDYYNIRWVIDIKHSLQQLKEAVANLLFIGCCSVLVKR